MLGRCETHPGRLLSMYNPQPRCMSCVYLGNCREVNQERLLSNYFCYLWQHVEKPEEVATREDAIYKFGPAAVNVLIGLKQELSD